MTFRNHGHNYSIVLALLVLSSHARAQGNGNPGLSARVDSIATAVLASTGVPSATVAVVAHGKVVYAQAYGSAKLEPQLAATPDMRYGIGSISKQFTAACVLLLQQEGKLKLDDPVSKYVPGLTRGNDVTIRQLLTHTSGLPDYMQMEELGARRDRIQTVEDIVALFASRPLHFTPGERFEYTSGVPLPTASGIMTGRYQMVSESGEHFEIDVPTFSLDSPDGKRVLN